MPPAFRKVAPTLKTNRAVALGYDASRDVAPRVLATGQGHLAEQIILAAKDHDVPIRQDPVLAATLATLELDAVVPPELYAVVAEVLAFVYRLKQRATPR